jgi:hypothetical protein
LCKTTSECLLAQAFAWLSKQAFTGRFTQQFIDNFKNSKSKQQESPITISALE